MDSKKFYQDYYGSLLGATITKVELAQGEYEGQYWPTFTVKLRDYAEDFTVEVSQDEEGNGPGFLFGLPDPKQPQQVIDDIAEVDPRLDCVLCKNKLQHEVHVENHLEGLKQIVQARWAAEARAEGNQ